MTTNGAVKIVLERRVRPGAHEAFQHWLKQLMAHAATSPELQGSSVLSSQDDHFILLRFADRSALDRWQSQPATQALLAAGSEHSIAGERPQVRSGLETWFTLPDRPQPQGPPPKWKMALVTWCCLLPMVGILTQIIPRTVPFLASLAVSTAIPVSMLTWVLMPRLTRLLFRWLYPAA
jgi:uncharacterized protein